MATDKWHLNPLEVRLGGMGGNSSGRNKARYSRSMDLTRYEWTLRHGPTGIEVKGEIPFGHYTRGTMKDLKKRLYAELFKKLEIAVARHLHIPRM